MFEVQHGRWQMNDLDSRWLVPYYCWCFFECDVYKCHNSMKGLGERPSYFNSKGFLTPNIQAHCRARISLLSWLLHMVLLDRTFWGERCSRYCWLTKWCCLLFLAWVYADSFWCANFPICTSTLRLFNDLMHADVHVKVAPECFTYM